jgi:hypothetical protein
MFKLLQPQPLKKYRDIRNEIVTKITNCITLKLKVSVDISNKVTYILSVLRGAEVFCLPLYMAVVVVRIKPPSNIEPVHEF